MGFKRVVKKGVKNNLDVKSWVSWNQIAAPSKVFRQFFTLTGNKEGGNAALPTSFEACVKKYGLTEVDIAKKQKEFFILYVFSGLLGLFSFGWMIYMVVLGMYLSGLVAFSLSALMFAYAFKEYVFYLQFKERSLQWSMKSSFLQLVSSKRGK